MNIKLLSPEQALRDWPIISPLLEKAMDTGQGESTMIDYMKKILTAHAQCWTITENDVLIGAGLTEILQYSQHQTLHIILFAGLDFEQQSKMFPYVLAYARDNGVKSVEQWGRKGWARTLTKYIPGFKEVYTVMRHDI